MRRKKQELSPQENADILYRGTSGVLALSGDEDYPYAVPMSYVYDGEKIYFHCAKSGHKLDAIQKNADRKENKYGVFNQRTRNSKRGRHQN